MKGKSQAFWLDLRSLPHGLQGKQWKLSIQFVTTTNLKRLYIYLVLVVFIYALTLVVLRSTTMIRWLFQHDLCISPDLTFYINILWCNLSNCTVSLPITVKIVSQFKYCTVFYFKLVIYAGPNTNSRKVTEYGGNTLGYGSRSVLGTGWPKDLVKVRKIITHRMVCYMNYRHINCLIYLLFLYWSRTEASCWNYDSVHWVWFLHKHS